MTDQHIESHGAHADGAVAMHEEALHVNKRLVMSVTANTAQWLTTAYMLTNGVLIPVSAFLIQRFSTRPLCCRF